MNRRLQDQQTATAHSVSETERRLDTLITRARQLADDDPLSPELSTLLASIERMESKLAALQRVANVLARIASVPPAEARATSAMIEVRLVPPRRDTYPTAKPHRGRAWAKVGAMHAQFPAPFRNN